MQPPVTHTPRPDPFTVLAIPYSFTINATPENCIAHLDSRSKSTENWQQWGFNANWEKIDADTWRVFLQQKSRWQDLRTICHLERSKKKTTRVSGYSEGNRKPFILGAVVIVALTLVAAVFMMVYNKDASWLELPVITLAVALYTLFSRRRAARAFITTLTVILSAE